MREIRGRIFELVPLFPSELDRNPMQGDHARLKTLLGNAVNEIKICK